MRLGSLIGRLVKNSPRREYLLVMLFSWSLFIAGAALVIAINFVWNVSLFWRILLTILALILTPSIQDLFYSFNDYQADTTLEKQQQKHKTNLG